MMGKRAKLPISPLILQAVRSGREAPDLESALEEYPEAGDVDVTLLKQLFDYAVQQNPERDDQSRLALDVFLAHRVHYALRLTPRVASDKRFWAWLSLGPLRNYVCHRWRQPTTQMVSANRFVGDVTRNAVARLWWYAEMARNGPDYGPVQQLFEDSGTLQYAMEAAFSRYRPAVLAFIRVSRGGASPNPLNFEQNKLLSKRINAYCTLKSLPGLAAQGAGEANFDLIWRSHPPASLSELLADDLLGPDDGGVGESSIAELERWFSSLLAA